jgi:hypothetical protein
MASLFGIMGLIIFVYIRPHEFFDQLKDFNFLYIFLFLALVGIAYDMNERRTRLMATPHLRYVGMLWIWCVITLAIRKPAEVVAKGTIFSVCAILYVVIAHGIQRVQGFYRMITVVFFAGLFTAYVGADQGFSPYECIVYNPADRNGNGFSDGRECILAEPDGTPHEGTADCIIGGKPGLPYQCEHAGLLGTTSVGGGRVRYLGVLLDPNELALATALCVPFAFAFFEIRKTIFRLALLLCTVAVVSIEIFFTGSRGGQLALGGVLGTYFIKKYGWKRGIIVGAILAAPILLVGGRHDEGADESTRERLNCAAAGIKMLMTYPLTGVGYLQYLEYHPLNAHNAYVLACGELGLPGMWLFGILVYLGVKIPLSVLAVEMVADEETKVLRALAMGMLAAFVGGAVGIFFLSWCYHYVLWIHFGMCGALYACTKRLYPAYDCKLSWKEARAIFGAYVAFLVFWTGYIKYKGAWD